MTPGYSPGGSSAASLVLRQDQASCSFIDSLTASLNSRETFSMGTNCSGTMTSSLVLGFRATDRKSTRLNSSHVAISYAVFCLKKKTHLNKKYNHLTMAATASQPS